MVVRTAGLGRAYWTLWWSSIVNNTGDGVWAAALPLAAASVTRDPVQVSLVSASAYLPWLLFSLPAGALADRHDRLALMRRSQVFACLVVAAATVAVGRGAAGIGLLCATSFLLGCSDTLFGNAGAALLPEIVSSDLLVTANARTQLGQVLMTSFVGPPLGSLLFGLAAWLAFGVDGLSFALAAGVLLLVRRSPVVRTRTRGSVRREIAEGVRWLARHRLLRTVTLILAVNCVCNQLAMATLVLLATGRFRLDAHGYGLLLAGMAVGGVLGGLVNTRLNRWLGTVGAIVLSLAGNALAYLAVGFAPDAVVLAALLAVASLMTTLWNVSVASLRQRIVPGELLGRVNGASRMLSLGLMPVGATLGGLLAARFGVGVPFPIAGTLRALVLLAGLPVLLAAIRRRA